MRNYMYRCDLSKHYRYHGDRVAKAMARVAKSGLYTLGREVKSFENDFARYIGRRYGIGVGSGTDALVLALKVAGIKPGDEVITTAYAPTPVPTAILLAGGVPVFTDIEEDTALMSERGVAKNISRKTAFIIAVHLFGTVCDMPSILKLSSRKGLTTIEDCAQAHGSTLNRKKAGTFAKLACFSFYPTKNLGGYGDGGMILTDNARYCRNLRMLRNYGKEKNPFDSEILGYNSRLDELQAAILRVRLGHLDIMNRSRRRIALLYEDQLKGLPIKFLRTYPNSESNYHVLTVICLRDRDKLSAFLEKRGIQTNIYYPTSLAKMKAFKRYVRRGQRFPVCDMMSRRSLALPMYPELRESEVYRVTSAIRRFYT